MAKPIGTGSGVPQVESDGAITAERLPRLAKKVKQGTGKGPGRPPKQDDDPLSDDELLAILENALIRVGKQMEPVGIVEWLDDGRVGLCLPTQIGYCGVCMHLRLAEQVKHRICAYCLTNTASTSES